MNFSIRQQLLGTTGLSVLSAVLLGGVGAWGLARLSSATDAVLVYNHAARNQLEADMMHDALRSDVYGALLARDDKALEEVRGELEGHAKWLRERVAANRGLSLNADARKALDGVAAPLEQYVLAAEELVKVAGRKDVAEKRLPSFVESFEALEGQMKLVSDAIEAGAKEAEHVGIEQAGSTRNLLLGWALVTALLVGFFNLLVVRSILAGLLGAVSVIQRFAKGDLTVRLNRKRGDELGALGDNLDHAIAEMQKLVREMGDNARTLSGAARELTATADQMAVTSEVTSERATSVSANCEQVQQSATVMASSIEELAIATQDVTRSVSVAAKAATEGVSYAEATNSTLDRLLRSGQDIGAITKTISSIAQQTNMLALNATIEAARAGEAGKGFAVVAGEVKELARQTESATDVISGRVGAIQTDTGSAVSAVREMSGVIGRINELSQTLASTMEEQAVTHSQISRSTSEVAKATGNIATDVALVASNAEQSSVAASHTRQAAAELLRMAETLERLVSTFVLDAVQDHAAASAQASRAS